MGTVLTLCTYLALLVFFSIAFTRFLTLWNAFRTAKSVLPPVPANPLLVIKTAGDIFFLYRLLKTNDLLWIVEWIFHCSFVLVILRHLRFVLDPVPGWVWFFQTPGLIAAYVLPVSLISILLMKLTNEKGYFPSYNFFLVVLLFLIGVSGLLMRTVFLTDVTAVKEFMVGVFTFRPAALSPGLLFSLHYVLVLILLVYLPSHMFAAPFVIIEARMRDEGLKTVMHDE